MFLLELQPLKVLALVFCVGSLDTFVNLALYLLAVPASDSLH